MEAASEITLLEGGTPLGGAVPPGPLGATGSHPAPDRGKLSCILSQEEAALPEHSGNIHPRQRPDWEEAISTMARGAGVPEVTAEPTTRGGVSTASMKVKTVRKLSFTRGHFPKLAECAHFHYENVDFGSVQLALAEERAEVPHNGFELQELVYLVHVGCQGNSWIVRRSYEDFRVLDKHLHLCIFDRRFSQLLELPRFDSLKEQPEAVSQMLTEYLSRLTAIADNKINCGPVLTWMEIDNKGNHLLVHEESSINVPAIAAAHVVKRYNAQAADELSFEVGDIVSVIDMPPKDDTSWWRGKHGFQVGFFPSECVELINDKVPQSVTNAVPKPVSKKHGKLITFLRSFVKSRPSKQKLKQRGILRERVFGCDLGEHLLNSGQEVPQVLKSCTEFIEKHGVVDGIYRLSGIASNIEKLRHEFDSEQIPNLTKDVYLQDIHCVGSLCKLYFRELPNPLLTYQLYHKFAEAVSAATDEERLIKIHDAIQQLPPPHYRTLEFLMRHLASLATFSSVTNMHAKNLAIVWAPNLLRSKQIESACFSGTAAFMEVRIQSVVVEFILNHVDVLFSSKLSSLIREGGHGSLSRPKSLLVSSPSSKLLTLEEAQARTQVQMSSPDLGDNKYIEVGEGPAALQGKFHTVIEFPTERKRSSSKIKKSPVGGWRAFFSLGKSSHMGRRKLQRNPSVPSQLKMLAFTGGRGDTGSLRSAKSEESLTSLHNEKGKSTAYRSRRPRSSSEAPSPPVKANVLDAAPQGPSDKDEGPIMVPALISPPFSTDDVELSLLDSDMASLDFDPMSFQCSLVTTEVEGDTCSVSGSKPPSPSRFGDTTPPLSLDCSPALGKKDSGRKQKQELSEALPSQGAHMSSGSFPECVSESITASQLNQASESMVPSLPSTTTAQSAMVFSSVPLSEGGERSLPNRQHRTVIFPPLCSSAQPDFPIPLFSVLALISLFCPFPGDVALDPPQGPAHVGSMSLLPPPPPPKSAARMLALALAQSASVLSQSQPSEPPTPASTLRPHRPPDTHQWSTPPYLQPQGCPEVADRNMPSISATSSSSPDTAVGKCQSLIVSLQFTTAKGTKLPSGGSGAHIISSPSSQCFNPTAQVPLSQSKLESNHVGMSRVLAVDQNSAVRQVSSVGQESSINLVPTLGQSVASHLSFGSKCDVNMSYSKQSHSHCNTLVPRAFHQSIKTREPQNEYSSVRHLDLSSPGHRVVDGMSLYPTISRAHSLNAPPTARCSVPTSQTEVPAEKELSYCQRPVYPYWCYQQPFQAKYHITRLQPYFENGKVQYRYSPYSSANSLDAPTYNMGPCKTGNLRNIYSFNSRNLAPHLSRVGGKTLGYLSRHALPVSREHSFVSRDMPPLLDTRVPATCLAWDPKECYSLYSHSIRRENKVGQKAKNHLVLEYSNVQVPLHHDLGDPDVIQQCSKLDPEKPAIINVPSRQVTSDPELLTYMELEKHFKENVPGEKASQTKTCSSKDTDPAARRPLKSLHQTQQLQGGCHQLQEVTCFDLKITVGENAQNRGSESGPWQEDVGAGSNLSSEQPEHGRHPNRVETYEGCDSENRLSGAEKTGSSCTKLENLCHGPYKPPLPPVEKTDWDLSGACSHQSCDKKNDSIIADDMEDCGRVPQTKSVTSSQMDTGPFLLPESVPLPTTRTYSTALGQGSFLPAEPSLPRSKAETEPQ
uniref:Rho GTPase activating protein 32a n=1 Tax=Scleropages formosus TaxID=113540 RepID=A0A8C9UYR9_SCLFO